MSTAPPATSAISIRALQADDVKAAATLLLEAFIRVNQQAGQAVEVQDAGIWTYVLNTHLPSGEGNAIALVATLPVSDAHQQQGYVNDDQSEVIVAVVCMSHSDEVATAGPFATAVTLQSSGVMKQLLQTLIKQAADKQIKRIILLQNQSNLISFTLYARLGWRPAGVYMFIEGWVESNGQSQHQYTVRAMQADDVDQCAELHQQCNGWKRRQSLLYQQKLGRGALVAVDSNDQVVGYWTQPTVEGHLVASNDDVVKALYVQMCTNVKQASLDNPHAPSLALSHRNYDLVCWFLQHKTIRASRQQSLMQRPADDSIQPLKFAQNGFIYCVSIMG